MILIELVSLRGPTILAPHIVCFWAVTWACELLSFVVRLMSESSLHQSRLVPEFLGRAVTGSIGIGTTGFALSRLPKESHYSNYKHIVKAHHK